MKRNQQASALPFEPEGPSTTYHRWVRIGRWIIVRCGGTFNRFKLAEATVHEAQDAALGGIVSRQKKRGPGWRTSAIGLHLPYTDLYSVQHDEITMQVRTPPPSGRPTVVHRDKVAIDLLEPSCAQHRDPAGSDLLLVVDPDETLAKPRYVVIVLSIIRAVSCCTVL